MPPQVQHKNAGRCDFQTSHGPRFFLTPKKTPNLPVVAFSRAAPSPRLGQATCTNHSENLLWEVHHQRSRPGHWQCSGLGTRRGGLRTAPVPALPPGENQFPLCLRLPSAGCRGWHQLPLQRAKIICEWKAFEEGQIIVIVFIQKTRNEWTEENNSSAEI